MNLMTYHGYCKKYPNFSNYNQFVDPTIFNLINGSSKSQVRLSAVETTRVPAMKESMRNHGQLAPCSVSKNSSGHWDLKEGFTRARAAQELVEEDPSFKLLISDGIDQIEGYGSDIYKWFDFGCAMNDHLPDTPNSAADIEVQINWRIDNNYFDNAAGCKRYENPKLWMDTAVSSMKQVYSNNSMRADQLRARLSTVMAKKQAVEAALQCGDVKTRDTQERLDFVKSHVNQLPFSWKGSKVGEVYNNNTVYFATRRRSLVKNIIPYSYEKTNSSQPPSVYLFVCLEPVEIMPKSAAEVQVERQWYRDEVKRINSHPFMNESLIKGLWFLPQLKGTDPSMNKFIK
jgi:hypothetical protein